MKKIVKPVMAGYRGLGEDKLNEILEKIDDIDRSYDWESISVALTDLSNFLIYDCMDASNDEAEEIMSALNSYDYLMDSIFSCGAVERGLHKKLLL